MFNIIAPIVRLQVDYVTMNSSEETPARSKFQRRAYRNRLIFQQDVVRIMFFMFVGLEEASLFTNNFLYLFVLCKLQPNNTVLQQSAAYFYGLYSADPVVSPVVGVFFYLSFHRPS